MTEQERVYFERLVERREQRAETINDPEFKSGFENNIDKYTDQAHFIYELLQNADDAEATQVRFLLKEDYLIFAHNGRKRFFVSNPDTVEQDKAAHKYGSVNSITAIGYSNKPGENAIGKFGIGFMSVFQYTKTPKIYDENICFQIDRLIVPKLIPDRPELHRSGETTLFVFPFNSERCTKETAYAEITRKLRCLSHPLMFLNTLDRIEYQIEGKNGVYQREETRKELFDDIVAKRMRFILDRTHDGDDSPEIEQFWFFSRGEENWNRYTVCFALETDDSGNDKLKKFDSPAFCFFQTKPSTGLHFAIHAPFLLTDNRESVKAGNEHNKEMVSKLAVLAADSLTCLRDIGTRCGMRLIDDGILNIIPTSEDDFSDEDDADNLSFLPFFTAIRKKMSTEELLPTSNGYVSGQNAYWADTEEITQIISCEQLAQLTDNPGAHWVFITKGRNRGRAEHTQYIDQILDGKWCDENSIISGRKRRWYSDDPKDAIIRGLNAHFIEQQSIAWLHSLYKWLSETDNRTSQIRTIPIFLSRDGHASAAFDDQDEPTLFLPSGGTEDINTIAPEFLDDPNTADFLINKVGVKRASGRDYIYNVIRPIYENEEDIDIDTGFHFNRFFDYYCNECPKTELDEFIDLIRDWDFLTYYEDGKSHREKASNLYFPSQELLAYFASYPNAHFVEFGKYLKMVGDENAKYLESFLYELGIKRSVSIVKDSLNARTGIEYLKSRRSLQEGHYYYSHFWEPRIENCAEFLSAFQKAPSKDSSQLLWQILLQITRDNCTMCRNLDAILSISYEYWPTGRGNHSHSHGTAASHDMEILRNTAWLVDATGVFSTPQKICRENLADFYDLKSEYAEALMDFLGIRKAPSASQQSIDLQRIFQNLLTPEQRRDIEIGRIARELGYTPDEAKAILEREKQKNTAHLDDRTRSASTPVSEDAESDADRAFRKSFERQSPARKSVLKSIMREYSEKPEDLVDEDEAESDEYTPPAVDFKKRIKRAEEKSRLEIDKITRELELSDLLEATPRYTCAWFRALMELEALSRSENESGSREISISFGRVEPEPDTERTLLLKQPSRYIPHWMEDFADDITLKLQPKGREIKIEVMSVKGYTLHARLRNAEDVKGIDLSRTTASISVQNPGFLLESLQEGFAALELPDDYDLKENLSENIKFVFGPPGTGKTTYLAREELIPLMRGTENEKVLVLAPTNKAADVLATRIIELMGEDNSYKDWLVRFGTTYAEKIELIDICKDRSFYLPNLRRYVLITTIARFPYDSIGGQKLHEMNWDRVVIDEASMIPIANIIFPLYRVKPKQFIIAGDPLQIQPVAQVEPNENIYKMVGLKSFANPHTEPHDYEVKLLTTQFRSVPSIGEVFSRFAYGGVLEHARSEDSGRQMNIDDVLDVASLNIIKFPVSKYEGIYRAKKLGVSSYQVYSALLSYEFAAFLARKIGAANPADTYSIGIISPYRAQADLIDRLLARATLPRNVNVQAGTIHGFQGDECDTIIAVFNPPELTERTKPEKTFLNNKNIINVAVSRARDCLFVLMPDKETEHIDRLKLVNKVEQLIKCSESFLEYSADEIEEVMFGRAGYLEENTFSTSHQNVNVYGLPEKRYEVRSEDTAIDVQIHEGV